MKKTAPKRRGKKRAEPEQLQLSVADLVPHPRNYKAHPDDQIAHIMESIRTHGVYRNVVVARDGRTILAGHGVREAALRLKRETVLGVRVDLDPGEPLALKLLAGDNEMARLGMTDDRGLTELLRDVKDSAGLLGTGFDDMMLANLLMVSRPASEVRDFNSAAEWVGMPEYESGGTLPKLVITFLNEEDRKQFTEQQGIRIDKVAGLTWSTRWPFTEREDVAGVRFEVEKAAGA